MYNEKVKLEYIEIANERNATSSVILNRYFNKTAYYENLWSKDLCNWNISEIMLYYQSLFCRTGETLCNINSQFKMYTQYCMGQGLVIDGMNHFSELDETTIFDKCVNTAAFENSIITRDELLYRLKEMKKLEGVFYNPVNAMLVLALFEGISGDAKVEIENLKVEDLEGDIIHLCTGRKFKISKELIKYMEEAQDTYKYLIPTKKGAREKSYKKEDLGCWKRSENAVNDDINVNRSVFFKINRVKEMIDFDGLTANNLVQSGKVHLVKQLFNQGMSYREALSDERVVNQYGETKSIRQFIIKYARFIEE